MCNTPTVGIQFIPQLPGATLLNMPLAPKKYRVVKNFMAQPGDFGVLASSETGIADVDVGALELTRFDRQRVEGSFSFDGVLSDWKTGKMQMISVTGRFSFSCRDSAVCTK